MNLEGSLIYVNLSDNNSRFIPRAYELPSQGLLARFVVLGICFFLWNSPYLKSKSGLLSSLHLCRYCAHGHILPRGALL